MDRKSRKFAKSGVAYIQTAPSDCSIGLHHQTAASDCTIRLHHRTAPSDCTVRLHHHTAPSGCTIGLHHHTASDQQGGQEQQKICQNWCCQTWFARSDVVSEPSPRTAWTKACMAMPRTGRAGQGRAGQGRAGQGRAGQGRAQACCTVENKQRKETSLLWPFPALHDV